MVKPIFSAADYLSLQLDVNLVAGWCLANSIKLNSEKCKLMLLSYSNRPIIMPTVYLENSALERVNEHRYLGVIIQANPSVWSSHCSWVLKRARKVFYSYRAYYSKFAPDTIWMTVYRSAIRSILDYCCDLFLPNVYFNAQFERLQKLVLRSYLRNFDVSYDLAMWKCNVDTLSSRRGASAVVNLLKYLMCAHFCFADFCVFQDALPLRRGRRGDTGRDLVLVRNYLGDNSPKLFITISPSFKKSFFFRATYNYNSLRRHIDLDGFSFRELRRVLSLFNYDACGLVVT